jgi:elongation factor Ts
MIEATTVKKLREETGAGIMDAKKALEESDGDFEKAKLYLKEKGLAIQKKKAGREASEGTVATYTHTDNKIGVLVELNSETDFVAKNEEFQELAHDIAMHITAMDPKYLNIDDVPDSALEAEKEIFQKEMEKEGKPADVIEKAIEGKLKKKREELALMTQPFVKDPDQTIADLITDKVAKIGENIQVRRFVRYEVGEEIE